MQAVILAAGRGQRLGALTARSTKCMVTVNGRRLIEYTLDALVEAGVNRVVLVVGHGADEVRAFVGDSYRGLPVDYVENQAFDRTNNIYSLLLAKRDLEADDTVVIESDILFDAAILRRCLEHAAPNVAVVARHQPWMDGTVVVLDDRQQVVRFLNRDEIQQVSSQGYFKTVNLYKLSRRFLTERFLPFLEAYVQANGSSAYYEEVLRVLVSLGGCQLTAMPVEGHRWYEIDDANDLDIASTLFADTDTRLHEIERRYGGFWRYPDLRDFCYLVNPYFPPAQLWQELAGSMASLGGQYPSGSRVQRLLTGRLLKCDPARVVLGNGASELIRAVLTGAVSSGNVGVVVPTFDEYRHLVPPHRLVELEAEAPGFGWTSDDLLDFCRRREVSTLVLVNPANPTGQFMRTAEIVGLLEPLRERGIRLILDESFVDFVDGTPAHTIIHEEILARYPNLLVVKSVSKSYGVPGLRLGALASGDGALIEKVAASLPIWNINSLAEYFLQIIGKYERAYWQACQELVRERARIAARLAEIPFLSPLPSAADYLLCEVQAGWTGHTLASDLLTEHSILVKDCSGKRGLEGGQYVRIAVRGQDDNEYLLECLGQLARRGPDREPVAAMGGRPGPLSNRVAGAVGS